VSRRLTNLGVESRKEFYTNDEIAPEAVEVYLGGSVPVQNLYLELYFRR
jgi:hypothetical protein